MTRNKKNKGASKAQKDKTADSTSPNASNDSVLDTLPSSSENESQVKQKESADMKHRDSEGAASQKVSRVEQKKSEGADSKTEFGVKQKQPANIKLGESEDGLSRKESQVRYKESAYLKCRTSQKSSGVEQRKLSVASALEDSKFHPSTELSLPRAQSDKGPSAMSSRFSNASSSSKAPAWGRQSDSARKDNAISYEPFKKQTSEYSGYQMLGKRTSFQDDIKALEVLTIEEKRKMYSCKEFITLNEIPTWTAYFKDNLYLLSKVTPSEGLLRDLHAGDIEVNSELNNKISLLTGDLTSLEIGCIVNAANSSLLGGGGVDGAIHRAAGASLLKECRTLGGCPVGDAKITCGYKLPAKNVIHTVGPMNCNPYELESSYMNSLKLARTRGIRSIAFPCISTGVYGFPNKEAAKIVLKLTREYLERNTSSIDRIIFCLFMKQDIDLYHQFAQVYFPMKKHSRLSNDANNKKK